MPYTKSSARRFGIDNRFYLVRTVPPIDPASERRPDKPATDLLRARRESCALGPIRVFGKLHRGKHLEGRPAFCLRITRFAPDRFRRTRIDPRPDTQTTRRRGLRWNQVIFGSKDSIRAHLANDLCTSSRIRAQRL